MKNKINYEEIFFLLIFLTVTILSCNGKNINMIDKERLLKERVQEYNNIMSEGKLGKTYNFICPQMRTIMTKNIKDYLLSLGDDQIVEDFKLHYKTESIRIEGDLGTVVSYRTGGDKSPKKTYHYWGFTDNNWYLFEFETTLPASQDVIEQYKKLIQNDQK